jgi:DNA (cytosine-5)-methyltransferase 1
LSDLCSLVTLRRDRTRGAFTRELAREITVLVARNSTSMSKKGTRPDYFVDLFAGCGGLSLGLHAAGWNGLFAVEKHPDAFETLKHNLIDRQPHYHWPEWLLSPRNLDIRDLRSRYSGELGRLRGRVKLVAGGPPCQGFSMAGRRTGDDARNELIDEYVAFIDQVRPKYLLLENVEGITFEFDSVKKPRNSGCRHANSHAERLRISLWEKGYATYSRVLQASDFAVPQRRPRFIMIGIRRDRLRQSRLGLEEFNPFDFLDDVRRDFFAAKGLAPDARFGPRDAISDLGSNAFKTISCEDSPGFQRVVYMGPRTTFQKLLHGAMNGVAPDSMRLANHRPATQSRFRAIIQYAEKNKRQGRSLGSSERAKLGIMKNALVVLHPGKPTHTVTTLPDDILHYEEPRILSVRENARLQTFPDWFEFKGPYTTGGDRRKNACPRYTQVGNAVPPFLAEVLGMLIKRVDKEIQGK